MLFAILDGSMVTHEEVIRIVVSNIADPLAAGVLAAQKIRDVVVHDDVYRKIGADVSQLDPSRYRLLARPRGDTRIYVINAQPVDLDRVLLEQRTPGRYSLVLDAFSDDQPRTPTLRTSGGETLASGTIQISPATTDRRPHRALRPHDAGPLSRPWAAAIRRQSPRLGFLSPFELRPTPDYKGRLND